jgi:hypothetical protein
MTERAKLFDAATLPINKPRDEYHPEDCECDYGEQIKSTLGNWEPKSYSTGSGHKKDCPSHHRWERNGRSWRTPENVKPFEFTKEAAEILVGLRHTPESIPGQAKEFLKNLEGKFNQYGDSTYISKHEISYLRSLKERYLL